MIARKESREAGRREGERRKDAALAILQERREVFVRRGRRALLAALLDGLPTACADDVRAVVVPPADVDPRLFGTVPGALAKAGIIRHVGFVKSSRKERHASVLQLWALVDRAAALRWLARNPDEPLDDELPLFAIVGDQQKSRAAATARLDETESPQAESKGI